MQLGSLKNKIYRPPLPILEGWNLKNQVTDSNEIERGGSVQRGNAQELDETGLESELGQILAI